jgi:hypothetical protein
MYRNYIRYIISIIFIIILYLYKDGNTITSWQIEYLNYDMQKDNFILSSINDIISNIIYYIGSAIIIVPILIIIRDTKLYHIFYYTLLLSIILQYFSIDILNCIIDKRSEFYGYIAQYTIEILEDKSNSFILDIFIFTLIFIILINILLIPLIKMVHNIKNNIIKYKKL